MMPPFTIYQTPPRTWSAEETTTLSILEWVGGEEWLKVCTDKIVSISSNSGDRGVRIMVECAPNTDIGAFFSHAELTIYPRKIKSEKDRFYLYQSMRRKLFSAFGSNWRPSHLSGTYVTPPALKLFIEENCDCDLLI